MTNQHKTNKEMVVVRPISNSDYNEKKCKIAIRKEEGRKIHGWWIVGGLISYTSSTRFQSGEYRNPLVNRRVKHYIFVTSSTKNNDETSTSFQP